MASASAPAVPAAWISHVVAGGGLAHAQAGHGHALVVVTGEQVDLGADGPGGHEGGEPDGAAPYDHHPLAGRDPSAAHAVHGHGERLHRRASASGEPTAGRGRAARRHHALLGNAAVARRRT